VTGEANELAQRVADAALNVPASEEARADLARRYNTTPEKARAMVRELSLWMIANGVRNVGLDHVPGTTRVTLIVNGKPL
jgi:hypothetical protein